MHTILASIPVVPSSLGMHYGPLWGLIALFAAIGLVFIVKAMECMGVSLWELVRMCKPAIKGHSKQKRKGAKGVTFGREEAIWEAAPAVHAIAGISEAGHVLFPGQASLAETLAQAYGSEDVDEALFSLCCEQELEDILEEAAELVGQAPGKKPLPISFLPLVTQGEPEPLSFPRGVGDPIRTEAEELLGFLPLTADATDTNAEARKEFLPGVGNAIENYVKYDNPRGLQEEGPSIFEELIAKCDTEAKLALLPELPAIADNKELVLLDKLCDDPDKRVRKLARKLGTALRNRLEAEWGEGVPETPVHPINADVPHIEAEAGPPPDISRISLEYCFLEEGSRREPPAVDLYNKPAGDAS